MSEVRVIDAEPDMKSNLAKEMIEAIIERGKIAKNNEYADLKRKMINDGVCEEDADIAIETIKRLRE